VTWLTLFSFIKHKKKYKNNDYQEEKEENAKQEMREV
jgi:hypothetical protein